MAPSDPQVPLGPHLTASAKHRLTGHNGAIFQLGPLEQDQFFLSAAGDGWVARWDLDDPDTGKLIAKVETQLFSAHYLDQSNQLVLGNMNGGVHWVPLDDPENTKNIAHHQMGVFAFVETNAHLLSAGGTGVLSRWEPSSRTCLESFHLSNQSLRCLDYSPARHELAVGSSDTNIYLLDPDSFEVRHTFTGAHQNSVFTVRYHPDGTHLLSGGRDAHLRIWSLNTLQQEKALPAHWYTLNDLQFAPNGKWFATASRDKTIKIWDAKTFDLLKVLETARDKGHVNSVNSLYWSTYNDLLISASDDRTIIVWEIE